MSGESVELPRSWVWRTVAEIGEVGLGRQRSPNNHAGPHMRSYVRAANITWNGWDLSDVKEMNFDPRDFQRFRLLVGDVLLNEGSGSAKEVGKPAIWRGEIENCCFQNTLIRVQPTDCTSEYLYFYFLWLARSGGLAPETQGVNIHHIGRAGIANCRLPVPPLAEQRRIVARIEALFARTRRARTDLERIAPLSAAYRRSALEQAFSADIAECRIVPLGSLLAAIEAGKNMRCEERQPRAGENGIVKISAVTWGRFDPAAIKTAPNDVVLDPRSRIANGDFLMSRANTLELVGAPVIAQDVPVNTFLSDKVLRLRFSEPVDRWVLWFLRSPAGRREIEARSSGNQLSMRNIGQGALRDIPVPMPAANVRAQTIAAIERGDERVAASNHDAASCISLLDKLEQSILRRAFQGELNSIEPSFYMGKETNAVAGAKEPAMAMA